MPSRAHRRLLRVLNAHRQMCRLRERDHRVRGATRFRALRELPLTIAGPARVTRIDRVPIDPSELLRVLTKRRP